VLFKEMYDYSLLVIKCNKMYKARTEHML